MDASSSQTSSSDASSGSSPGLFGDADASSADPAESPGGTGGDENRLHVSSILVRRLFGVRHELEVDRLCAGVNVICGPNASGKTTLARAVCGALWPAQVQDESPFVEAQFHAGGSRWTVQLEGRQATYRRDGQDAERPSLPPQAHHDRYHLYLHDLLAATSESQNRLAEVILQEAVGGYDVEGAADALGYDVPQRTKGLGAAQKVMEAQEKVREAEQQQEELQRRQQQLESYREKLAEARTAEKRAQALSKAAGVAETRRELETARARLDAFPDALAEVRGDEVERLDDLRTRRDDARRKRENAAQDEEAAESAIAENDLPEEGLPDGFLETLSQRITTLRDREQALRTVRQELRGAREEASAKWDKLSDLGVDEERAASVGLPDVRAAEEYARKVEEASGREEALETLHELLFRDVDPDASPDDVRQRLREGLKHLHRWLQLASADERPGWVRPVTMGAGVLVALSGAALLAVGTFDPILLGIAALLVVLGVATLVAGVQGEGDDSEADRQAQEDAFGRLRLSPPPEWEPEAVETHSDALMDRWRDAALKAEKVSEWERRKREREELRETINALKKDGQRLRDALGLEVDVRGRGLFWLVDKLQAWQSAHERVQALEEKVQAAEEDVENARAAVEDQVADYTDASVDDAADAEGVKAALASAQSDLRDARRDRREARRVREEAEKTIEETETAIGDLYDALGVEAGDEAALRELVNQHDDYQEAKDTVRDLKTRLDTQQSDLRRMEGYEEAMEEAAPQDLLAERERAEETAARAEELQQTITAIETRVEDAKESGTLEERRAEYRARRDELAQQRDADYRSAAGSVLAEYVQDATQDRDLPGVFRRAQELFAAITNGRYSLALDRTQPAFTAVDAEEGKVPLDALSSGTKVQLLLAVRIAFVEEQERGYRLPLVLDEVLANSDDEKADAIIEAVRTISQNGRQVIYLTAQHDEVAKWQSALQGGDGASDVPFATIGLADTTLRDRSGGESASAGGDDVPVPVRTAPADRPDPASVTHREYGEAVDVPNWSPRQSPGSLHLWYLIDDVETLDELVGNGVQTWGQLRNLQQYGGHRAEIDDATFERVRALAGAVAAWKEAWSVGRGKEVDRDALAATDAVTDTFMDRVTDLARDLNGDAEELLRELRVRNDERAKRFLESNADQLEEYFRAEGYLDPQDTLSEDEQWRRVLAATADDRRAGRIDTDDLEALFARFEASPVG